MKDRLHGAAAALALLGFTTVACTRSATPQAESSSHTVAADPLAPQPSAPRMPPGQCISHESTDDDTDRKIDSYLERLKHRDKVPHQFLPRLNKTETIEEMIEYLDCDHGSMGSKKSIDDEKHGWSVAGQLVWITRERDGDTHIELRPDSQIGKTWEESRGSHIVVEVSPYFRHLHPRWDDELANRTLYIDQDLCTKHTPTSLKPNDPENPPSRPPFIRVTGWLLRDYAHFGRLPKAVSLPTPKCIQWRAPKEECKQGDYLSTSPPLECEAEMDGRATPWEIHPVTRLETCDLESVKECNEQRKWKDVP